MPRVDEAIILAGGFGTRLQSVVKDVPKPLAPVAGRPFIEYLLDLLAKQGIRKVVLATGYLAEVVERTLGDSWKGMSLAYSVENVPLGTGGALAQAIKHLVGDAFFVLNGDTFLYLNYEDFDRSAEREGSPICMALADVADVGRYGAVETVGSQVVGFSEKGAQGRGRINAGVYRIARSLTNEFPRVDSFSFEQAVLVPQAAQRSVTAYTDTSDFIDIGVPEDFERAQSLFSQVPR
ncbi:nucleotidyltransferase family protein [Dyella mobilis]|uniref:Nucleotidyltransferase family protein n=1 Tax=Dyella mobilis TaxID=1849582 RepID=A0ABS2KMH1_9GAMM|nr:nucleotidyltransferase family protein [Dyella mobilis]MBM7132348.1 nucleotidyltransferase family protein [Dyella mobilis]GLQ95664.1 D-glycero-D-manno-heptose 1-phosphate guanosyltransferase [Dyella mobilis]